MTAPRSSIYQDALKVSPTRISRLSDVELNELMSELLCAHAYRCGARISEVRVNTDGQAKDDGSDGWSPKPPITDEWFGSTNTCWQFKAGTAGQPSRLKGEIKKRIPRDTLRAKGRFVVVASGSTNGKKGEQDRLKTLRTDGKAAKLSVKQIDVFGSERIAGWCNQFPAVAARWAGRPVGLLRFEDWSKNDQHQAPWQAIPAIHQQIADLRRDLDFATGTVLHLGGEASVS